MKYIFEFYLLIFNFKGSFKLWHIGYQYQVSDIGYLVLGKNFISSVLIKTPAMYISLPYY